MHLFRLLCLTLLTALALHANSDNPIEVGHVAWTRDFPAALAKSRDSGKPVFLLFQEVPGCAGCQTFGKEVLRHPLMVEAVEDAFIPVLVYNNRDNEADLALLRRYDERAWNFQVVRFLDSKGEDLIPRKEGVDTLDELAVRMIDALETAGRKAPRYLRALAEGEAKETHAQAAFAMHCFWTGEYELGAIEGVIDTEAGWIGGREVALVTYDRNRLSFETLSAQAKAADSAEQTYTPDAESGTVPNYHKAKERDQKKQLERYAAIKTLPGMTPMQLTKINALLPRNKVEALSWLSPRQRAALEK